MKALPPVLAPFRSLRYSNKITDLGLVVAPPYDVISADLKKRLQERHPYNVIRLILGMESSEDSEDRYARAATYWDQWIREGILVRDTDASIYLYEQDFVWEGVRRKRRGFIALRRLENLGAKVLAHEETMEGPKEDRLRLMKSCHANLSPLFSLYQDPQKQVSHLLTPLFDSECLADVVDDDQVRHRLWGVRDRRKIKELSELISEKPLLLADGHHRYETALVYREFMKKKHPKADECAPFHYMMIFFCDVEDPGLLILPTHRVVLGQGGFLKEALIRELEARFEVRPFGRDQKVAFLTALGEVRGRNFAFGVGLRGRYYLCSEAKKADLPDVVVVHRLLPQLLDLTTLLYLKEPAEVFRSLEQAEDRLAIFLNPIGPSDLMEAVTKGIVLPPKSTYFYPKLLTGLVFHPMRPEERVTI